MKTCPKCQNEHQLPGTYCSRKCANSRQWTAAINARRSRSVKRNYKINGYPEHPPLSVDALIRRKETFAAKRDAAPFEELSRDSKKARILKEQNFVCRKCGIKDWCGEPLMLQLEHKDGDNQNDSRENLECLCPNCHSQTPTFGSKNQKKRNRISDDTLLSALRRHPKSIASALKECGMTPRGKNYVRVNRLIEKHLI